jgi:hypothetical protein
MLNSKFAQLFATRSGSHRSRLPGRWGRPVSSRRLRLESLESRIVLAANLIEIPIALGAATVHATDSDSHPAEFQRSLAFQSPWQGEGESGDPMPGDSFENPGDLGSGDVEVLGVTVDAWDFHYFQWTADDDGFLTVSVTSPTADAQLALDVYSPEGEWLAWGGFWDGAGRLAGLPVQAGKTYILELEEWGGVGTQYDLSLAMGALQDLGVGDQIFEGSIAANEVQGFQWTAEADGLLGVLISSPTVGADLEWDLYDSSGEWLTWGGFWDGMVQPGGGPVVAGQTYYLVLEEWAGLPTDYEFSIAVDPLQDLGSGDRTVAGTIAANDFQGFRWTAETDGLMTATFTSSTDAADLEWNVYSSTGEWLASGGYWGDMADPAELLVQADVTYVLVLEEWSGQETDYQLSLALEPHGPIDLGQGDLVYGGVIAADDTARFRWTADADGLLTVAITSSITEAQLGWDVLDPEEQTLAWGASWDLAVIPSLLPVQAGQIYLLDLEEWNGLEADYEISLTTDPHAIEDLAVGEPQVGTSDEVRWFRWTAEAGGLLTVTLTSEDPDLEPDILDGYGNRISDLGNPASAEVSFGETYFVRIFHGSPAAAYDLSISFEKDEAPWQNGTLPTDVNGDGVVSPIDALLVINYLNRDGSGPVPEITGDQGPPPYLDVNGDGFITPIDALLVINLLNRASASAGEGELVGPRFGNEALEERVVPGPAPQDRAEGRKAMDQGRVALNAARGGSGSPREAAESSRDLLRLRRSGELSLPLGSRPQLHDLDGLRGAGDLEPPGELEPHWSGLLEDVATEWNR